MAVYGVIMAGGIGSRFWPQSRKFFPKQLLKVFGEETLIQQAYQRLLKFTSSENVLVVTNGDLVPPIKKQIPELKKKNFVVEPFGKNTAPCLALTAFQIAESDPDAVMVVVPADHLIRNVDVFSDTMKTAISFAKENEALITLGINPTHPETGYGYLQKGDTVGKIGKHEILKVKTFAEKPNLDTAERFIESNDFFWNSGMFIWRVNVLLKAIDNYLPDVYEEFSKAFNFWNTPDFSKHLEVAYKKVKGTSIDYGVMQEAENVFMIPGNFKWNDIGSWDVVAKLSGEGDKNSNIVHAKNRAIIDTTNSYISSPKKLVATVGIDDLIVIDTEDALLICKKERSQDVKDVVDDLKIKGLDKYL
ncbi:MAG: mannose-1-phosphate guanylyltransferase [Calditrichia bacterium]|nr:mannose-1-phosphate guanylyltransferase [Calditrichia bacterium]